MEYEIYIVGSLTQIPQIQEFASQLSNVLNYNLKNKWIVNDWWTSHGPQVDTNYWEYCCAKFLSYEDALRSDVALNVFSLDRRFIERAHVVIMFQPCGRSAALELGYAAGLGKFTVIIKNEKPSKIEIMENFANMVYLFKNDLFENIEDFEKSFLKYLTKY
jgi:hypothetical protein